LCRTGAEKDMCRPALGRRVRSLRFDHDGEELTATVGAIEPYRRREPIVAIVAFDGCYILCTPKRGLLRGGDSGIVGSHAVRAVEDIAV